MNKLEGVSRRQLRRLIFTIRDDRVDLLDNNDKEKASLVYKYIDGFLLGSIGWADFSLKWDIHPEYPDCDVEIISLFEWKEWLHRWIGKYGKDAIPPPCFTRQGRLKNGGEGNI
jgi:hypothetical protein